MLADVEAKDAEINRQQREIQTLTVRKQSTISNDSNHVLVRLQAEVEAKDAKMRMRS